MIVTKIEKRYMKPTMEVVCTAVFCLSESTENDGALEQNVKNFWKDDFGDLS